MVSQSPHDGETASESAARSNHYTETSGPRNVSFTHTAPPPRVVRAAPPGVTADASRERTLAELDADQREARALDAVNAARRRSGLETLSAPCSCGVCPTCHAMRLARTGDGEGAADTFAMLTETPEAEPIAGDVEAAERIAAVAEGDVEADGTSKAKPSKKKRKPAPTAAPRGVFAFTDSGNAERFARDHGADLRYCTTIDAWMVWDGRRWSRDETNEVVRRTKATVRNIPMECSHLEGDARTEALRHAIRSESAKSRAALVQLARAERPFPVVVTDLDADPWLFNVQNGTIDLHTGELRPHQRGDLLTKASPVEYDPDARSETWERFLSEALDGHTDDGRAVIEFLQRAAGYSLTGDTSEEKLFFAYGPGGGGKSTFLEAVRGVLGDYAATARFEMFLKRSGDAPSATPELARLKGARFVASIEVDEGKRISEGTIKSLTGGDNQQARELYKAPFEFRPQFKLWLAANDPPRCNDTDNALFRRLLVVGFPHERTGEGERDTSIKATLTNVEKSGAAILAWAVKGCLAWQRDGLKVPKAVLAATADYRRENDPLAEFFAERVEFAPSAKVTRKELRAAYETWVDECGTGLPLSAKKFSDRLRARLAAEHGANHVADTSVRLRNVRSPVDGWSGVSLRGSRPAQPPPDRDRTEAERDDSDGMHFDA